MAQVIGKGSSLASLYECETSLAQVISDLRLKPLSSSEAAEIRSRLGKVVGRGFGQIAVTKKLNPNTKLETKRIAGLLRAIACDFQAHEPLLRGAQTGFRQSHEIEAATRIRQALSKNSEIGIGADIFLGETCDRLNTVSQACLVAATDLQMAKAAAGRKTINWFDDFTRFLVWFAEKNGIRATIVNDRVTGAPSGRFFELAVGFEKLLDPRMRAPSLSALGKRLSRSLPRLT